MAERDGFIHITPIARERNRWSFVDIASGGYLQVKRGGSIVGDPAILQALVSQKPLDQDLSDFLEENYTKK